MPSDAKSMNWFVRITAPWLMLEPKVNEVKSWIDVSGVAVGYHIGGKTKKEHVHLAISMCKELQKQSIDVRFKKLFGVKGADYSSKIWDGSDKVLSYLYHDPKGKIEYHKMELSAERLDAIKKTADVYSDIVKTAKDKASTRIPDQCLEAIKASGEEWTDRKIAKFIISGIAQGKWYNPGMFQIEKYVQEVALRQNPTGDYVDSMVDEVMRRLMR